MDIGQFVTKKLEGFGKPCPVVANHEAQSERRFCRVSDLPSRLYRRLCLGKHYARVV